MGAAKAKRRKHQKLNTASREVFDEKEPRNH